MTVALRPYQVAIVDALRQAMRAGHRRILLQLPTGGGKTLTTASMLASALAKGSRSMFVAHRLELIDQPVATFARLGVTSVGVIRAKDRRRDPSQPIQVASILTLAKRGRVPDVRLIVIDEAHRSCAKSYVDHVFAAYPDAFIIGMTATPVRGDGKPLGGMYQTIVHGPSYSELIAQGHIVEPMVYSTPMQPDLSAVHTRAGDYAQDELEAAVNRGALIGNIWAEWSRISQGRRTVIFAVSVAHSRAIVEQAPPGVAAEHLDGETPEDERAAILARLELGQTHVVSNYGVLCEGWDQPSCKCVVLARPTKSLVIYMQSAGRTLRPWCPCGCERPATCPRAVAPIILDHGGNVDRHGMPHEDRQWSLDDKPKRPRDAPMKACRECFAYIPSALMVCPHCAYEFPAPTHAEEPAELETLDHVELALRSLTGDDAQLSFWRREAQRARDRRMKPGYVYHRFIERFQTEPPIEWVRSLKRAAKKDADWRVAFDRPDRRVGT